MSPLFYIHVSGTTLIFIQISKNWPAFLKSCTQVDLNFINANYASVCNARRKVNLIVAVSNCLVILEHGLATANFILSKYCQNHYSGWEHYFRKQFHFIFNYFDYHFVYGFLLLVSPLLSDKVPETISSFHLLLDFELDRHFCLEFRRYLHHRYVASDANSLQTD